MTLRERLSWHALGHAVVDPRLDRAVMARVAIYMYLSGTTLGVASLVLAPSGPRIGVMYAAAVGALVGALAMLSGFHRIGQAGFRCAAAFATVLVTMAVWAGGVQSSNAWVLYLGIVFFAVYFFDRREAAVTSFLAVLAYGRSASSIRRLRGCGCSPPSRSSARRC